MATFGSSGIVLADVKEFKQPLASAGLGNVNLDIYTCPGGRYAEVYFLKFNWLVTGTPTNRDAELRLGDGINTYTIFLSRAGLLGQPDEYQLNTSIFEIEEFTPFVSPGVRTVEKRKTNSPYLMTEGQTLNLLSTNLGNSAFDYQYEITVKEFLLP